MKQLYHTIHPILTKYQQQRSQYGFWAASTTRSGVSLISRWVISNNCLQMRRVYELTLRRGCGSRIARASWPSGTRSRLPTKDGDVCCDVDKWSLLKRFFVFTSVATGGGKKSPAIPSICGSSSYSRTDGRPRTLFTRSR